MSSPFQKQFSAKSPLNGNYYSGVDGLQYVSPKIPESKTPADTSSKTKTPETIIPPTETPEIIIPPTETPSTRDGGGNQKINDFGDDVIKDRTEVKQRPTYRQAWGANLDGIRGKYKDYESYVNDRTGQKTVDPDGYEKDLFDKTNLKTPGREEIDYQKINDEDETITGRRFFTGKEFKI